MAIKLASAFVDVSTRSSALASGLAGIKGMVSKALSPVSLGLTALGGAAGGIGLGAAGIGFLKLAADAEQAQVAFNVILKDMDATKKLLKELADFSVVTPFEPQEVRAAGQSLLAFGTTADLIQKRLKTLGDIAAGGGGNLGELVQIFNKIKSEGKLTQETFQQLAERGANVQPVLQKQLGITAEKYVELRSKGKISFEDTLKALEAMTTEGGIFFGAMQQQSQTLAGLWSTLSGNFKTFGEQIGNLLAPAAKLFVQTIIDLQNQILAAGEIGTSVFNQIGTFIRDTALSAVEWFRVMALNWRTVMDIIKESASFAFNFLKNIFFELPEIVAFFAGSNLRNILDFMKNIIMVTIEAMKTVGQIIVSEMQLAWERVKALFTGEQVSSVGVSFVETFTSRMADKLGDIGGAFKAGFNKESILNAVDITPEVQANIDEMKRLFGTLETEKRKLEQARVQELAGDGLPVATTTPLPKKIELTIPKGFFGFDELSRKIQEDLFKTDSEDKKQTGLMEANNASQKVQERLLKDQTDAIKKIAASPIVTATPAAVASA